MTSSRYDVRRGSGDSDYPSPSAVGYENPQRLVECLAPCQHGKNHFHAPLPGFRFLCRLQPVSNGIAVGFIERFKEFLRLPILAQGRQKLLRKSGITWRIVGGRPAAVAFGGIYFSLASRC